MGGISYVMTVCYLVLLRCHFFQLRSVSIGVSIKKVGGRFGLAVFIHVHQVPLCGFHDSVTLGAVVGLVGERMV